MGLPQKVLDLLITVRMRRPDDRAGRSDGRMWWKRWRYPCPGLTEKLFDLLKGKPRRDVAFDNQYRLLVAMGVERSADGQHHRVGRHSRPHADFSPCRKALELGADPTAV